MCQGSNRSVQPSGHSGRQRSSVLIGALLAASTLSVANAQFWLPGPGDPSEVPAPPNDIVHALLADGRHGCYAGGQFTAPLGPVALWDGSEWSSKSLGLQSTDVVHALVEYDGRLMAAGSFTHNGNNLVLRTAYYDASVDDIVWSTPDENDYASGEAYALVVYKDMLIVGGAFELDNGIKNIVGWDGLDWHNLGQGNGANGAVYALEVYQPNSDGLNLYAGGAFTNIGRSEDWIIPEIYIAKYNDMENAWNHPTAAAGEFNAPIRAMHAIDSGPLKGLYIGGDFDTVGTVTGFNHVARYKVTPSSFLQKLGDGTNGVVRAFCDFTDRFGMKLVAGGEFTLVDGSIAVQNVASWTASGSWIEMDHGVGGAPPAGPISPPEHSQVNALCTKAYGCYAAGELSQCGADEDPCRFIAQYRGVFPWEIFHALLGLDLQSFTNTDIRQYDSTDPDALRWIVSAIDTMLPGTLDARTLTNTDSITLAFDPNDEDSPEDYLDLTATFQAEDQIERSLVLRTRQDPHAAISVLELGEFQGTESALLGVIHAGGNTLSYVELGGAAANIRVEALQARHATAKFGLIDDASRPNHLGAGSGALIGYEHPTTLMISIDQGSPHVFENAVAYYWNGDPAGTPTGLHLEFMGDFGIDGNQSGFGFQSNTHRILGEECTAQIFQSQAALLIDCAQGAQVQIDGSQIGADVGSSEISFMLTEVDLEIAFGAPLEDLEHSKFQLSQTDDVMLVGIFMPNPRLMGRSHTVRVMHHDDVIAEFTSPDGTVAFDIVAGGGNGEYGVMYDSEDGGSKIDWTDPGLVVLHIPQDDPEIDGATGLWISPVDADDDGILDQLEPTSYTFTTTRSTQLTILDEVFTPNDEPADEPADINGDGKVDGQDLAALLGAWGSDDSQADINGDGVVDGQDLAELLGTWN